MRYWKALWPWLCRLFSIAPRIAPHLENAQRQALSDAARRPCLQVRFARTESFCAEVIRDSASLSPHVAVIVLLRSGQTFSKAFIPLSLLSVRTTSAWSIGRARCRRRSAHAARRKRRLSRCVRWSPWRPSSRHAHLQSSLPATIEARYSTPLSFRVGGKIIERRVRLGDSVKAGEIVAKLDPADNAKNAASAAAQLVCRAASAHLCRAATHPRPGAGAGKPDLARATRTNRKRLRRRARAAQSGPGTGRVVGRSVEVHHAHCRPRRRHHGGTG